MIPTDVLSTALSLIGTQTVMYYAFASRSVNSVGIDVPVYAAGVSLEASVQAVPRNIYMWAGLDFQKDYVTIFVSQHFLDVKRDVSGDYFTYNGSKYQCLSNTDWYGQNGWVSVLCVRVGAA